MVTKIESILRSLDESTYRIDISECSNPECRMDRELNSITNLCVYCGFINDHLYFDSLFTDTRWAIDKLKTALYQLISNIILFPYLAFILFLAPVSYISEALFFGILSFVYLLSAIKLQVDRGDGALYMKLFWADQYVSFANLCNITISLLYFHSALQTSMNIFLLIVGSFVLCYVALLLISFLTSYVVYYISGIEYSIEGVFLDWASSYTFHTIFVNTFIAGSAAALNLRYKIMPGDVYEFKTSLALLFILWGSVRFSYELQRDSLRPL